MDESLDAISKILALGGNGAAVAALLLAWKIMQRFETIMERNTRELRAMREAIIAGNPDTIESFREHDAREFDRKV